MHSVKSILTNENRTCAIRPTAIQSMHPLASDNEAMTDVSVNSVIAIDETVQTCLVFTRNFYNFMPNYMLKL